MISVRSPDQYPPGHVHHFRLSVRILAGLVSFTIIAGGLEIGLRLWSFATNADIAGLKDNIYGRLYSPEELQPSEPDTTRLNAFSFCNRPPWCKAI
jgi:hypothetical protein